MHKTNSLFPGGSGGGKACLSGLLPLALAFASLASDRFPFNIPGDDATPSVTDFARLSPRPAGADGFVRLQDGHFVTDAGRLKIWGVNVCFGANFPTRTEAEKVAAHLAKLGVNGVRFHHHDTAPAPRGVLGPVVDGKRGLDPTQVERLDYFLDQLHRRGIYANLNLHVGRTLTEAEGFLSKDLPYSTRYNKYLLYFEPRMREAFKEFCRAYLSHRNPHRQLKRAEDPGIAMIEITNENFFSKLGPGVAASLPEPYRGEFMKQWNRWLARRYANTAALKQAWGGHLEPLGAFLLEAAPWTTDIGAWKVRQSAEYPLQPLFNQPGPAPEVKAMKLAISRKSAQTSDHELQYRDLALEPGKTYTLSFWGKADAAREIYVDVSNQGPADWGAVGLRENIKLGPQWRRVALVFKAAEKIPGKARVCFKFGGDDTDFHLAQVALRRGGEFTVVPEGQSLEQGNLEIPVSGWCEAAKEDAFRFMVQVEKDFIRDITSFLKNDLGVKAPVTASQITYHGAEIVAETCDYADIHAYWQHPRFPGKPWDPTNWFILNTPMECSPEADSLLNRAPWRLFDRPFTISEWNIPDPHDYAASVVPFAALVASLQDWDGVFFFQYHSSDQGWFEDAIKGYFSFNSQPAKLVLLAACANLYRRGDLPPLPARAAGTLEKMVPSTLGLTHRLGIDPRAKSLTPVEAPPGKRLAAPDGRAVWEATDKEKAHVWINTPASKAVWGLVAGQTFNLGGVEIQFGALERRYAAVVLTSLDGQPVDKSKTLLLAAVGSAQNQGMVWNEKRTSVGRQWGKGPVLVNGITAEVTLPGRVRSVHALDGRGQRRAEVPLQVAGPLARFSIGPQHQTLWYEIVGE